MKLHLLLGAALSLGASLFPAAPAAAAQVGAAPDKNACIFSRSIQDFRPLDRNKLVVWGPSRRDAYLVELSMPLPQLKFAHELAVVDRNHDGRLCGYGMDRIVVVDAGMREPSTVSGITLLDDARLAELEQQYGVKLTRHKGADSGTQSGAAKPGAAPAATR
jgi:hypothetical protein